MRLNQESIDKILETKNKKYLALAEKITKNDLENYYKNHSKVDTINHFNLTSTSFKKLLKIHNINKTNQEKKETYLHTMNERYGVYYPIQNKEIKNKIQQTCFSKYNAKSPLESNYVKDKIHKIILNKYNVDYALQSKEIQDKIEKTWLDKYGVSKPFANKEIQNKIEQTLINKYGSVEKSYEIRKNKMYQTKEKLYNNKFYNNFAKYKETCLCKYGIPYYCMTNEARKFTNNSKPNKIFSDILESLNIKYEREFTLKDFSYDFKIENNLIEINPFPTHNSTWGIHNEKGKPNDYHYNKTILAKENGFRCIHIWDWDDKHKIINSLFKNQKIYARNCEIKEVSKKECNKFLNDYHFQNSCHNQVIRLGLYYENELIEVMVFGKPRYNKNYEYELLRLCTKPNYLVVGGTQKLFNYFKKIYQPISIISYCDNSKFNGEVYSKLGFTLKDYGVPSKHWYNIKTKKHITDNLLRQQGFDRLLGKEYGCYGKGTSNEELMLKHDFVEIYDSGQSIYTYKTKN